MTWARLDVFVTPVVEDNPDEEDDEEDDEEPTEDGKPAAESVVWLVPVDDPSPESGLVVDESAAFAVVTAVPSNVAAASTPNPAEAASPASVVPIVRFRRRWVAREREALPRCMEAFMTASWTLVPFGSMTTGGCVWVSANVRCRHPRSPRTGPVHVRFGGWMQGPAMDCREWRIRYGDSDVRKRQQALRRCPGRQ